ncbi:GPP34 family phosphoprotein [Amycolatopsis balhimycina DSM 5908]|uniref:GPP34 family phosphoprotein n=1 Tax=Amycolatopsis balhimycina DSM 5908 TaxID=1081091 RepID=A0A428VUF5_AMYBA|nr:GPP34 family phosphoprotein [Amycolatopsis balhimycina]RSM34389.1 GPP34 family phosphoprotein [Amycolatopsis balhimycina DSM 5908]
MTEPSLPARAYLLACDTRRDRLPGRERVALLVRAAALTDLVLRGRVADDGGRPAVTGAGGTGHLVLDDLLAELTADPHRKWRAWVRRGARATLYSLEAQLDAAGTIELRTSRVLGVFPRRRPVVRDVATAAALHDRVTAALRTDSPVPRDIAALTSLAAAAELGTVFSRAERRRHRARLAQLEDAAGVAVPALRKVLRELQAARAAAIAASSGGGG